MEKQQLFEMLPDNIIKATELSDDAKKVLAALLVWAENSKAVETGIIAINDAKLAKIACIRKEKLKDIFVQLRLYDLVYRKVGGFEQGKASEYDINFDKLEQPLKKRSFSERFARFKKEVKSSENPLGTTLHNITLHNSSSQDITCQDIPLNNNPSNNSSLNNNPSQDSSFDNNQSQDIEINNELLISNKKEIGLLKENDLIDKKELIGNEPMAYCDCTNVREYSLSDWKKKERGYLK